MTKKILVLALIAAVAGFVRAADVPAAVLIPTPLEPQTAVNLAAVPGPATPDLSFGEPSPSGQAGFAVIRAFGGLRPAGDTGKTLFHLNLIAMVGLNIADYVSTRAALKYPGLHEVNPLMQPFVKSPAAFAAVKIGTTVLGYWSMKALFKKNRTVAWVLTTASNVLMSYAVANNLQRIQQARAH
jgi:hypothetical protein